MESADRTGRTGVGLPMKVTQRKSGYKPWLEEFVNTMRVEVFDCEKEPSESFRN